MKFAGHLKKDHYRKRATDILGTHSYYYTNKRHLCLTEVIFFPKITDISPVSTVVTFDE